MGIQDITNVLRSAITTVLLVSSPMLIGALISGFIVALFQATTQINEPTLAFVPKIVVVMVTLVVFSPWIAETLSEFTLDLFNNISTFLY
ncbi:MAG: flagellar biosynthesis protein FliQ [Clostridia bacterium]